MTKKFLAILAFLLFTCSLLATLPQKNSMKVKISEKDVKEPNGCAKTALVLSNLDTATFALTCINGVQNPSSLEEFQISVRESSTNDVCVYTNTNRICSLYPKSQEDIRSIEITVCPSPKTQQSVELVVLFEQYPQQHQYELTTDQQKLSSSSNSDSPSSENDQMLSSNSDLLPNTTCFGILHDDRNVCGRHGKCIHQDVCQCDPGYSEKVCDLWSCNGIDVDISLRAGCHFRGTCTRPDNCTCDNGHRGQFCQQNTVKCYGIYYDNYTTVCSGHGWCAGENYCRCHGKYKGKNCSIEKELLDYLLEDLLSGQVIISASLWIEIVALAFALPLICCVISLLCILKRVLPGVEKLLNEVSEQNIELIRQSSGKEIKPEVIYSPSKQLQLFKPQKDDHITIKKNKEILRKLIKICMKKEKWPSKMQYTVFDTITSGEAEVVFAAHSNHLFAVKRKTFVLTNCITYELNEINALLKLQHPNLIDLEKVFFSDFPHPYTYYCYTVMPYVKFNFLTWLVSNTHHNAGLSILLSRCVRTVDEVRKALIQVLQCLEYLHEKKLMHCDMKFQNVLIDENFHVYVTDLEFIRKVKSAANQNTGNPQQSSDNLVVELGDVEPQESRAESSTKFGCTPGFAAPEYLAILKAEDPSVPRAKIDGKVDIFSFGVMLYLLFVKPIDDFYLEKIHKSLITQTTIRKRMQDFFVGADSNNKELQKHAESLEKIITSCLEDNPQSRKSAKELLKTDFFYEPPAPK